jgi:hypothetical protein
LSFVKGVLECIIGNNGKEMNAHRGDSWSKIAFYILEMIKDLWINNRFPMIIFFKKAHSGLFAAPEPRPPPKGLAAPPQGP